MLIKDELLFLRRERKPPLQVQHFKFKPIPVERFALVANCLSETLSKHSQASAFERNISSKDFLYTETEVVTQHDGEIYRFTWVSSSHGS